MINSVMNIEDMKMRIEERNQFKIQQKPKNKWKSRQVKTKKN